LDSFLSQQPSRRLFLAAGCSGSLPLISITVLYTAYHDSWTALNTEYEHVILFHIEHDADPGWEFMPSDGATLGDHYKSPSLLFDFDHDTMMMYFIDPPLDPVASAGIRATFDTETVFEHEIAASPGVYTSMNLYNNIQPFRFRTESVEVVFPGE